METQISFSNQEKYPRQGFTECLVCQNYFNRSFNSHSPDSACNDPGINLGTFRNRLGSNNGSTKQMEQLTIGNRPFHQYSLL